MAARLLEGIKVQEGAVETMLHPSDTEIEKSLEELKSKGGQNVKDYRRLCELLCDQVLLEKHFFVILKNIVYK